MRTTCTDDVHVTPGVVLHEIGQLRQVFAWVSAINLTSNNRSWRSGKSDKRKPSWTALHKDERLTCWLWTDIVQLLVRMTVVLPTAGEGNVFQKRLSLCSGSDRGGAGGYDVTS